MIMSEIEKQNNLKRENLSEAHYVESLLYEAASLNLISQDETNDILMQSIPLLAKQTERYTEGKSSSVRVETAQSILQSLLYTVGLYLKNLPDASQALTALKETPLEALFEQGKAIIAKDVRSAKRLLGTVKASCTTKDNIAYNNTVQRGIDIFFALYDSAFAAHETPGSIDYPLSNDKMDLTGIEYMNHYIKTLYLENQFCRKFKPYDINCVLRGYDSNCKDLLINIFEQVLTNALGCELRHKNITKLKMEQADRTVLQQELENFPLEKLCTVLQEASVRLYKKLDISGDMLREHITQAIRSFAPKLKSALENHQLDSVFVSLKEPAAKKVIKFSDGEKMNDELFSMLTEDIKECRFAEDKAAIIKRDIHSMLDLVDIFEGDYIFGDEFTLVFQTLEDIELALLLKKLPEYMTASGNPFTETEKEWEIKFTEYLISLDNDRNKGIRELAERID